MKEHIEFRHPIVTLKLLRTLSKIIETSQPLNESEAFGYLSAETGKGRRQAQRYIRYLMREGHITLYGLTPKGKRLLSKPRLNNKTK